MATFREWFDEFTQQTGEIPDAIVFGWVSGWGDWQKDEWPTVPTGVILWRNVPPAVMDHEFRSSYGGNESPNLCAWSKSWVIFSDNYDGAESLCWVPRHPIAHEPIRPGGG